MENTQTGDVKMPITYEDLKAGAGRQRPPL